MSVEIANKEELVSLASSLNTKAKDLDDSLSSLKSTLGNISDYDGINIGSAGRTLSNNLENVKTDIQTVSSNIVTYAETVTGFDIDDFSTSSGDEVPYEDLFKNDGTREGIARSIWNFLKYKGLSDYAAAAVLGNIQAECNFDPAAIESATGKGFGLIQWTGGRRTALEAAAKKAGVSPSDLQFQLEYLWKESLDPNSSYGKSLTKAGFYTATSASDAAKIFHDVVEKSADSDARIKTNRCDTAEKWYAKFKGTSAGNVGSATISGNASSWADYVSGNSGAHYSYSNGSGGHSSSGSYSSGAATTVDKFPETTADKTVKIEDIDITGLMEYLDTVEGKTIVLPEGYGRIYAYMGWQCITNKRTDQYRLLTSTGLTFNEEGFGMVGDRYVVAVTQTYGNIGDFIDVVQEDGTVIKCIIGDYKGIHENIWGHANGKSVVEFVVDKASWYGSDKSVAKLHPEWIQCVDKIINKGNYFDYAQEFKKITDEIEVPIEVNFADV